MFFLFRSIKKTIQSICDASEKIADGDLSIRILPSADRELSRVAQAINAITESLEERVSLLSSEKEWLAGILEGMAEGVLVIDSHNIVELMNPSFCRMAGLNAEEKGKTQLECVRNKDVHDVVSRVLHEGVQMEKEVSFGDESSRRVLIMHAVPLASKTRPKGVVCVFNDVTALRRLEQMRRDFVANVSHELKTPLTNIRGYAETLLANASDGRESGLKFVEKIERNAIELERLVNDILDLSRIESGGLVLNREELLLQEACDRAAEPYLDRMASRRLEFRNMIPPEATIVADDGVLFRMLSNVIDNAVKYTRDGGTITCSARKNETGMVVEIQDTGRGIPEESLPHLFERFYRVDAGRSRELGGTGLGLAIVKHLAQIHGGTVSVESQVGRGSSFSLFLPFARAE